MAEIESRVERRNRDSLDCDPQKAGFHGITAIQRVKVHDVDRFKIKFTGKFGRIFEVNVRPRTLSIGNDGDALHLNSPIMSLIKEKISGCYMYFFVGIGVLCEYLKHICEDLCNFFGTSRRARGSKGGKKELPILGSKILVTKLLPRGILGNSRDNRRLVLYELHQRKQRSHCGIPLGNCLDGHIILIIAEIPVKLEENLTDVHVSLLD